MAKEYTKEELKATERFVGTPEEFDFVGKEDEVVVIEVEE